MQELHRAGGNRDFTLGGHTQVVNTKQYLHRNLGYIYLGVLEGLLGNQALAVAHCVARGLVAEAPGNINWHVLSWKSPFWHQHLAPPNSLQAPVLEQLRANNQQDRNTAPPISRQAA